MLAVAVSGGADSTALALLTQNWAAANQGRVLALIADHGLRPDSAAEAALTQSRLAARGIASKILTLAVPPGPALQARARDARFAALTQAARQAGCLHLLLGHHAADQAETVAMRAARGDGGLEGMAAWTARNDVLLLRPLLGIDPADLRAYLRAENMQWVEDPSNTNPDFERVRIRQAGTGQTPADPAPRQQAEQAAAAYLAANVTIRPEGFAVIHANSLPPLALAGLLRIIAGAGYAPPQPAVTALAANLRPATLGGVRIAAAGRYGPGWLLAREFSACTVPVAAAPDVIWDGRFRLSEAAMQGAQIGALGRPAANHRKSLDLPALVLQTMPCLHLPDGRKKFPVHAIFTPPAPAAAHPFLT
jgi:tRNA(Ile)-lysidine synthase